VVLRTRWNEEFVQARAVAIGLEAGLQVGEACALRINDVDLESQSIRVRRSNRTGVERTAHFHVRTKKALEEWLRKRPNVDHDYLRIRTVVTLLGKSIPRFPLMVWLF
jgi:integrase